MINELTLNDVIENDSLFLKYREKYNNDFIFLYDNDSDDYCNYLDNLFLSLHGQKIVNNYVLKLIDRYTDKNILIEKIVDYIHYKSLEQCKKLKELYNKNYDVLNNSNEKYTENFTSISNGQNTSQNENNGFNYGFNSENEVKDSKNTFSDSGTTRNEITQNKTYEKTSNNSGKTLSELIDTEIERTTKLNYLELTFNVYSIILTIIFAMFVNISMYYKLRQIDMVESLKSVE